jgi:ubiquinone/menaquinone biosynthesis C-methylase UbiE
MMLLKCLKCGAKLNLAEERCVCPQCGAEWPVNRGIPRFFQAPSYYWGEIGRNDAGQLLQAARSGSWKQAVQTRFSQGDDMWFGVLDLQRASWAPLLGLDDRSVVLDIGAGYGAITHSLSRSVAEVYSVEAIPERIEFIQERLRQEGIANVSLIQASATALPLLDKGFDLIVINGVLEWVGEWDLQGDARSVQLRFLRAVSRLLKDDGVLVIGIENRFGYAMFMGSSDHSGMAYTSLVPRRVASLMLRYSSKNHHRTQLNARKEYRTYTYSERGYRSLLADAGFPEVSCYWAEPGYNQPYHLIPLSRRSWVREHFLDLLDCPGPDPQWGWRRRFKRSVAQYGLPRLIVSDFLLLASKRARRKCELQLWLEQQLRESRDKRDAASGDPEPIIYALFAKPFQSKSVVRLGYARSGRDVAYLKINVGAQTGMAAFESEIANREKVRDILKTFPNPAVAIPQGYGVLRIGNTSYSLESAAQGTQLSRVIRRPRYFANPRRVEDDFVRVFPSFVHLTKALQMVSGARTINAEWREIPEMLRNLPEVCATIEEVRYFKGASATYCPAWIQHGDFSVENLFLDQETNRIEVVDWADLAGGLPPLYDFFQLLLSTAYLSRADESVSFPSEMERWIASFRAIFLADTPFARIVRDFILRACTHLKVQPDLIPSLLVEFLLIRSHYYKPRSIALHRVHLHLLKLCVEPSHSVFSRGFNSLSSTGENKRDLSSV